MKALLLAGGLGTRMREETDFKPKPMVEIGGEPILVHIMRNLATFGITDFVIASGYKSEYINEYFSGHQSWIQDSPSVESIANFTGSGPFMGFHVAVVYTGEETGTGGRVSRVRESIGEQSFFVTYGDGLANVNVGGLIQSHAQSGRSATLTVVQPTSRFGLMDIDESGAVTHFREKPKMKDWVSIGYFIFEPEVFDYLTDDCGLEEDGLVELAAAGQLQAFKHNGFWLPMDTFREYLALTNLWDSGEQPWRLW